MSTSRTILTALPALAILGGCQLLIGLDGGKGTGAGGGTASASSSSSGASSSSSSGASSSSSSGAGGAGGAGGVTSSSSSSSSGAPCDGGVACSPMDSCPKPTNVCLAAICVASCCGTMSDDTGVPDDSNPCTADACSAGSAVHMPITGACTLDGNPAVCGDPAGAAKGTCVGCNVAADCASKVCTTNACQAPSCADGVQNGAETGVDCGGSCAPCPAVVLLAGGPVGVLAGVYGGAAWATTPLAGTTADGMSIAFVPTTGQAVGLMRASGSTPVDQLQYTLWSGASWSAFASINGDTTRGQPAVVATGGTAHAVYLEPASFFYKYEAFTGGAWTAAAQPVVPAGAAEPCGPNAPALAPFGAACSLAFVNGACGGPLNHLYNTDLSGTAWLASKDVASDPSSTATVRPALAAPASGPELVVVYVQQGTTQILSAARTSGVWSAPAAITNGLTNDSVSLAPLPGSGVVLAYRGTDNMLYTAVYTAGTWSLPAGIAMPNVAINATPAVARGIGAARAELAYTDANGVVFHTRLLGTAWTAPAQVAPGTGFAHVALGSGP